MIKLSSRKQIIAHDKKCNKINKQVDKALMMADKWGFDKFNACKSNRCRNTASKKEQFYFDKSQTLQGKQSNCQRNRPE